MDILSLHRKGLTQREIARKLGISRNTVKKYIEDPQLAFEPIRQAPRPSMLDPFEDNIKAWIEEDFSYKVIFCLPIPRKTMIGHTASGESRG